jgi:hypothetical protein
MGAAGPVTQALIIEVLYRAAALEAIGANHG